MKNFYSSFSSPTPGIGRPYSSLLFPASARCQWPSSLLPFLPHAAHPRQPAGSGPMFPSRSRTAHGPSAPRGPAHRLARLACSTRTRPLSRCDLAPLVSAHPHSPRCRPHPSAVTIPFPSSPRSFPSLPHRWRMPVWKSTAPTLLQGKPLAPVWQAANQPRFPSFHTMPARL